MKTEERFAILYTDGSMGIMPSSYDLSKSMEEAFEPGEDDPAEQPKIGRVSITLEEIIHDPTKGHVDISGICPHCQKEIKPYEKTETLVTFAIALAITFGIIYWGSLRSSGDEFPHANEKPAEYLFNPTRPLTNREITEWLSVPKWHIRAEAYAKLSPSLKTQLKKDSEHGTH